MDRGEFARNQEKAALLELSCIQENRFTVPLRQRITIAATWAAADLALKSSRESSDDQTVIGGN
jgi:hypothetical protein